MLDPVRVCLEYRHDFRGHGDEAGTELSLRIRDTGSV
jgi:hypothetical protein